MSGEERRRDARRSGPAAASGSGWRREKAFLKHVVWQKSKAKRTGMGGERGREDEAEGEQTG